MASTNPLLPAHVEGYLNAFAKETRTQARCREATKSLPLAVMQIAPTQGDFLRFLIGTLGVKRAIEVGVFTGYSSLVVAESLPADGKLLALDVSEEWTSLARKFHAEAGISEKIELVIAPAAETLKKRLTSGEASTYDFSFIDADKENYALYFELSLELLRPGGVIVVDNTLWSGSVAAPEDQRATTVAIRSLNERVHVDPRVTTSLIPVGDGLLLARKL